MVVIHLGVIGLIVVQNVEKVHKKRPELVILNLNTEVISVEWKAKSPKSVIIRNVVMNIYQEMEKSIGDVNLILIKVKRVLTGMNLKILKNMMSINLI